MNLQVLLMRGRLDVIILMVSICLVMPSYASNLRALTQDEALIKNQIPLIIEPAWDENRQLIVLTVYNVTDASINIFKASISNPQIIFNLRPEKAVPEEPFIGYGGNAFVGLSSIDVISEVRKVISGSSSDVDNILKIPAKGKINYTINVKNTFENRITPLVKKAQSPMKLDIKLEFFNLLFEQASQAISNQDNTLRIFHTSWVSVPLSTSHSVE